MRQRVNGKRWQEALFPNERTEPVRAEVSRELVRALADLMLEALGHGAREEAISESEDHN
jgi:hypothetical protein